MCLFHLPPTGTANLLELKNACHYSIGLFIYLATYEGKHFSFNVLVKMFYFRFEELSFLYPLLIYLLESLYTYFSSLEFSSL